MNNSLKVYSIKTRGRIFVLSAPSGTGKTSLINEILKLKKDIKLSVSYTTREKRDSEIHGKDYVFTSQKNFEKLIIEDFFIEYANIYGNYYGVPKINTESVLNEGTSVIYIIDYHGFKILKNIYKKDVIGIYVLPPSGQELANRLQNRASDDNINERINDFNNQLQVVDKYDYLIINDDLSCAAGNLMSIIDAELLSMKSTIFLY